MEEKINFEQELKRLDEIVEKIQNKNISIDENIALFEEGNKIIVKLQKALKEAEAKVEKVIESK